MLMRMTHVRVDEQGALSNLCGYGSQICRQPAATFVAPGTGYRQNLLCWIVGPSQSDQAGNCAERFDQIALGCVGCNHIVTHSAFSASRKDGIVELLSNSQFHIGRREPIESHRSITKSQSIRAGVILNLLG